MQQDTAEPGNADHEIPEGGIEEAQDLGSQPPETAQEEDQAREPTSRAEQQEEDGGAGEQQPGSAGE